MNGPANWPMPFVTTDVRSVSAAGTTLLGVMVFGELLGVGGWAGAVLLLGALVLLAQAERR